MAITKIHVGDIGTKIRLDAGEDISSATLLRIKYKKPSGETGYWTAVLEGTRYAAYTTLLASTDDLDESGLWEFQLYLEMPSWSGHGEIQKVHIYKRIDD